jgi:predicted metal-dependent phosphoesterase TrpH
MASKVDLHIHTTASDGRFSPQEIVSQAAELGVNTIAICDHDTIDGVLPAMQAAAAYPQLTVIPGVEISTHAPSSEVHILGYFIDVNDSKLKNALVDSRHSRLWRAKSIIAKLKELNINIDWQQVEAIAGDSTIGRPHIAQAMLEMGYIKTFKEAFDRYIGLSGPAYVERHKISPPKAVALVKEAAGIAVLAHPFTADDPQALIIELKAIGLAGIEVYYNDYTADKRNELIRIADKHDLIATGGSDYHGIDVNTETMLGEAGVPLECAEKLLSSAVRQGLKSANP